MNTKATCCASPSRAVALAAVFTLVLTTGRLAASTGFDRWYAVLLQGQPIGWAHEKQAPAGPTIKSSNHVHLELRRGSKALDITVRSVFEETSDGRPIRHTLEQNLGLISTRQKVHYGRDAIEVVMEQGGQVQRQHMEASAQPWLPPAAAARFVEQQIDAGADQISFWTSDPTAGLEPFESRMTARGRANIEVHGKVVPALVWDTTVSVLPGVQSRVYTDGQGRNLKTTMTVIPGMSFEMVLADPDVAKARIDPPEIVAATLVRPDRVIPNPRAQRRTVYELTFDRAPSNEADAAEAHDIPILTLPTTGVQRVSWPEPNRARVVVSLDDPVPAGEDLPADAHRRASATLNHEDPAVADLVGRALEGAPADISPNQKAEQLRAFVREFVQTKDLSVGFATASEVARTAQGDCTEHAVLLAGLLRAAGIPSRTVSGLIYVSDPFVGQRDVFGYHMWTQAWLMPDGHAVGEPRWVDLDATRAVPFDSAHIALGVSAMDDTQLFNDLVKLAPMLGRVGIKVLESDGATKRRSDEGGDAPAASHGCWLHERQISAPYVVHIGGSLFHQTRGRFAPPFVASSLHRFPQ